jgi:hypothetical protein
MTCRPTTSCPLRLTFHGMKRSSGRLVEALCTLLRKGKDVSKEVSCNAALSLTLTALTLGRDGGDVFWDKMDLFFLQLKVP